MEWMTCGPSVVAYRVTLSVSAWCAPFQRTGVTIEDLRARQQTEGGAETFIIAMAVWARRWPSAKMINLRME